MHGLKNKYGRQDTGWKTMINELAVVSNYSYADRSPQLELNPIPNCNCIIQLAG